MSPKKKTNGKSGKSHEILIPEKLYFRIGEVARLCRLPAYVLRFWETEFPQLKPVKSSTGQRMYRRRAPAPARRRQRRQETGSFALYERDTCRSSPDPARPAGNPHHSVAAALAHNVFPILEPLSRIVTRALAPRQAFPHVGRR